MFNKFLFRKSVFKSFTIAEILITLSIIGIVASLTIPSMMAEYQKQVYLTRLQKFYSQFQQGIKLYMSEQGCQTVGCTDLFKDGMDADIFLRDIPKIFKVQKICLYNDFNNTSEYNCDSSKAKYMGQLGSPQSKQNGYFEYSDSYITLDGFLIGLWYDVTSCKLKNAYLSTEYCSLVYVDINGEQKPNIMGRDFFSFVLGNNGVLYPEGGESLFGKESPEYWKNSKDCGDLSTGKIPETAMGRNCSARIIEEGWRMNY